MNFLCQGFRKSFC